LVGEPGARDVNQIHEAMLRPCATARHWSCVSCAGRSVIPCAGVAPGG